MGADAYRYLRRLIMTPIPRITFITTVIFAALSLANFAAAGTFDFSYTFLDGRMVTGTLTGNQNGNLITDVNVTSLIIDGVATTGTIYSAEWNPNFGPTYGMTNSGHPVIGFDNSLNNFGFFNSDFGNGLYGFDAYFYTIHYGNGFQSETWAFNGQNSAGDSTTRDSSWSLTNVSSVPEGGSTIAMLSGAFLGLVTLRACRATSTKRQLESK